MYVYSSPKSLKPILHRFEVTAVDAGFAGLPVESGKDVRELGVLVEVPAGETVRVQKSTKVDRTGTTGRIVSGATTQLTLKDHGLHTGENITITESNCTPSIDGVHAVTVLDRNLVTIAVVTTADGNFAKWSADSIYCLSTESSDLTTPRELIVDHSGGPFSIGVTAKSGASPMNIWVRML